MFGPLGFPEMLFILVLALLIFGPKRLPEVGRTIGKGMAHFRRATTDLKRTIESEISLEDDAQKRTRPIGPLGLAPPTAAPAATVASVSAPAVAPPAAPATTAAAPPAPSPAADPEAPGGADRA